MKIKLLSGLLSALFASTAFAFIPFTVKDIRIEGIQRTEAGTVFSYLPVKVGETMTDEKASAAVKALFATGFFKDVRLEIENEVLVVVLDERPAIANVEFVGIKAFDKDQLKKGLKEVGLAESATFDRALLEKAEQELKRQYLSHGNYGVKITTTVTPLERNRVGLNFTVDEGEVAKIKQINIVGNESFKDKELLQSFALGTTGWLSWYSKNDQYSKQKLSGDLEKLRSFYLDQGYIEFSVDSTQVSISPDKQDIYITVSVTEGKKFNVSSVKLAGDLKLPEEELKKLVAIKPGETFSREKLTLTTKNLTDRLGNEGYAFANVNAVPELDKAKSEVAFTLFVDPGRRVYVRRLNVAGNTRTRDEVIRREARQMEGAWYDGDKINMSRKRVDRLGYFESVNVETPAVPGTTDQVDVNMTVKEKPTGSIMLGAGFSSSEKLVLSGSVSQNNVFGSGNSLAVQVNSGSINKTYSLSFTDPYYTKDGVARGFDLYKRNVDSSALSTTSYYKTSSIGAGVRYGFPISEDDAISAGLSFDSTKVSISTDPAVPSPQQYINFVNQWAGTGAADATVNTFLSTVGWAKDERDSLIWPTQGSLRRLVGQLTLPIGAKSMRYYTGTAQYQKFFPIGRDYALMVNGEAGYAKGYGGQPLPFFKNFYAGGIGSVRGYESSSLGPHQYDSTGADTGLSMGGNRRLVVNAEFLMPMPGMGQDRSVRLSGFVDGGQVWGVDATGVQEKMSVKDMRFSTGLGVSWNSPMGPIKFTLAKPLNKKVDDKTQMFQFQMGNVF
ncbi:MAG: outer membrane protein assembly factor BamA [Rhodocyclaceae bacterium]|nr:outer membrane protein assembly factor BamA [Rhodocyclaceae bacterium]